SGAGRGVSSIHFRPAAIPCRLSHGLQKQYRLLRRKGDQRRQIVSELQKILTRYRKACACDGASRLQPGDDCGLDALGIEAAINPRPREVKIAETGSVGRQSPLRRAGGRTDATARWIDVRPIHLRVDAVRTTGPVWI